MTRPTVALDAMGGDHAPKEVVAGALLAVRSLPVHILLVGPTDLIAAEIDGFGHQVDDSGQVLFGRRITETDELRRRERIEFASAPAGAITLVHASDFIGPDDKAANSVRSKPDSSIAVATKMVKTGVAGGVVSAGNTGAVASAATVILGRLPGILRPGIAVPLPTAEHPVVLIDAGANSDCRPDHLLHFGVLGSVYSHEILDMDSPRVGILSIGEEPGKGNELVQKASLLLSKSELNFIGNIEGRDIMEGTADVVVTDGFTGNVALKTIEGAGTLIARRLKEELLSTWYSRAATLMLRSKLDHFKESLNPEQYGGAHLLGVKGICVITHGSSSRKAIAASIVVVAHAVEKDLVGKLTRSLQQQIESAPARVAIDPDEEDAADDVPEAKGADNADGGSATTEPTPSRQVEV